MTTVLKPPNIPFLHEKKFHCPDRFAIEAVCNVAPHPSESSYNMCM